MKNIWIIANWKSNKTIAEALDWVSIVGPQIPKDENVKVVVCPTFSCLSEVKKAVAVGNFPLMVGSQDLSPFDNGTYTGEEAASLLNQLISLSIIGHSERRQNFGENDEMVSKKVDKAKEAGIIPLVCVQGPDTSVPEGCKLVAYEPIFAIGTGNPDTPQNAENVAKVLKEKYGEDLPAGRHGLEVLYGGSVTAENIKDFINMSNICGALIGQASLDAEEFIQIVNSCKD